MTWWRTCASGPAVVARCPVAAIRPAMVNGKPSLEVDEKKCMCCGACYPPCPPMQINDPVHSKLAIWVGGKNSNARSKPMFQKLVAAGLPNNPPRWPEVAAVVKKILYTYKKDARDWERVGDWVERIGWPRFFENDRTAVHQVPSSTTGAGRATASTPRPTSASESARRA